MFLSNQAFQPGRAGGDSSEQGGLQHFQAALCAGNTILALVPVGLGWAGCLVMCLPGRPRSDSTLDISQKGQYPPHLTIPS